MAVHLHAECGRPRTLFLGDIENLAGRPTGPTDGDVVGIAAAVDRAFGHLDPQPVIACAHHNAPRVWFNWPNARHLVRSGPNGADLRLIEVIEEERIGERFDIVIVGSADGDFAEAAAWMAGQGVHVVAAVGRGRVATKLRLAVHVVVRLPIDPITIETAEIVEEKLSA